MKKVLVFGLVVLMVLPALLAGCGSAKETTNVPPSTSVPPLNGGQEAKMIELTLGDFSAQNNIVQNVELIRPGHLIVTLGANPTTGFEWGDAVISDDNVVAQESYNYVGPTDTTLVGAGGNSVWAFGSQAAGTATIKFSYGRPWEGGEKDVYTLTLNVTVK